jgi:hypothetical protein
MLFIANMYSTSVLIFPSRSLANIFVLYHEHVYFINSSILNCKPWDIFHFYFDLVHTTLVFYVLRHYMHQLFEIRLIFTAFSCTSILNYSVKIYNHNVTLKIWTFVHLNFCDLCSPLLSIFVSTMYFFF